MTLVYALTLCQLLSANTGGLAASAEPQPIRAVRSVTAESSETSQTNYFTRFEEFHLEQIVRQDLRAQLTRTTAPADFVVGVQENIDTWVVDRDLNDRARAVNTEGRITALAVLTLEREGWETVDGWRVTLVAPGWFYPVFYNSTPIAQESVVRGHHGPVLLANAALEIEKALRDKEETWKTKINRNHLKVILEPMRKRPYEINGFSTGRMYNWESLKAHRLNRQESRQFLSNLRTCQDWLD